MLCGLVQLLVCSPRELPNPKLELFDLDEAFSSEKSRLAQITNKCSDVDLDYFVREAADILGITQQLPVQAHDSKHIMEYVLTHIVEFKKLNQDLSGIAAPGGGTGGGNTPAGGRKLSFSTGVGS